MANGRVVLNAHQRRSLVPQERDERFKPVSPLSQ